MILTRLPQLPDPESGGLCGGRQDRIRHRGHGRGRQADPRSPGRNYKYWQLNTFYTVICADGVVSIVKLLYSFYLLNL